MHKLLILIIAPIVFSGCMRGSSPTFLSLASERERPKNVTILKKGIIGKDCSSIMPFFYGSYSKAIDNALLQVEGANVLVNIKLSRKEMPILRICVMVEGDAGKL